MKHLEKFNFFKKKKKSINVLKYVIFKYSSNMRFTPELSDNLLVLGEVNNKYKHIKVYESNVIDYLSENNFNYRYNFDLTITNINDILYTSNDLEEMKLYFELLQKQEPYKDWKLKQTAKKYNL